MAQQGQTGKDFQKISSKLKEKQRGYHDYRSNGLLLAVVWYDRNFVHFVTIRVFKFEGFKFWWISWLLAIPHVQRDMGG